MKAIELYFIKKLSSVGINVWQNVISDVVSVIDPKTLTDEKRIAVIKQFIKEMVIDSITDDVNSEAIIKSLNNIVDNDESIFDINKSLATLASNDVEILLVERDDLPAESPLEEDAKIKTLIVNKTIYDSKLLCCGSGRGHLYTSSTFPVSAFDFMDFFDMTKEEMKDCDLFRGFSQWEVLRTKAFGGNFVDDTKMIDFLKHRGYEYYYLYL